jgi:uncharacterized protein with GYD domain
MKQNTLSLITLSVLLVKAQGFAPHFPQRTTYARTCTQLSVASSALPDTKVMKAAELRKELQSYGISTKSFFEKGELVDAVNKARVEGKKQIKNGKEAEAASGSASSNSEASSSSKPRSERLAEEMEKCKSMKVGELKKELESFGISTKSFFEKSEFVKALAEARVDGVAKGKGQEEPFDPTYRDVVIQKMSPNQLGAFVGGGFIDTTLST